MWGRRSLGWLAAAAVAAAAFSGFALAPAFSSGLDPMLKTKALTKSKAKKLFYTKKAADSRFLSKADADSRFYSKSESDGRYLTKQAADESYLGTDGATILQASPLTWEQTNAAASVQVQKGSDGIFLTSGVAASPTVAIGPTVPSELQGQPMRLLRVNACYLTPNATTVTAARIQLATVTAGPASISSPVVDATPRTDDACRDYTPSSPVEVGPNQYVTFEFSVNFPGGGGQSFGATRATFYVEPVG
jgi:hypothetical protein